MAASAIGGLFPNGQECTLSFPQNLFRPSLQQAL
jgi:hypothetical protein